MMKKNFLTGVAILFPIVLTFIMVRFFVNLLTQPFLGLFEMILPLGNHKLAIFLSKLLILLALFLFLWIVGVLARLFIGEYVFQKIDSIVHRIPIIRRIYKTIQESVHTVFQGKGAKFSRVVLVPFPHEKCYSLGFVTNEHLPEGSAVNSPELITIFVPGTPVPTIGFVLLYAPEDVLSLSMSVEEGFKFILSCGAKSTSFTITPPTPLQP